MLGTQGGGGGGGDPVGIGALQQYTLGKELAGAAWKKQKTAMRNRIQWQVADMKDAGLNPILAARGGFGGGVPTVGMASASGIASAAAAEQKAPGEVRRANAQARQQDAQTKTTAQQGKQLEADTEIKKATLPLIAQQVKKESENARASAAQADILENQRISSDIDAEINRSDQEQWRRQIERWGNTANAVIQSLNPIRHIMEGWRGSEEETTNTKSKTTAHRDAEGALKGSTSERSTNTTKRKNRGKR